MNPELWYTTAQIADLGKQGLFPFKSVSSIYQIINSGEIKYISKGNQFLIQGKELIRFSETLNKAKQEHDKQV